MRLDFPSLLLPEDVLREIISIVHHTSYSTVPSLLQTSRLFHALTRPLLYRYIAINLRTDDFKEEIQLWLTDPDNAGILKAIRHICINTFRNLKRHANIHSMRIIGSDAGSVARKSKLNTELNKRDKSSEWLTIAALISQTTQLQSLTFACPEAMPLVLLQSIHKYHPTIHLNIASWTRPSPGAFHTDPAELALLGLPSLRSLQATIYNPERNIKDLRLPAFWRLVRSSPNLDTLILNISYGGCVIKGYDAEASQRWTALALGFEHTTVFHGDIPSGIRKLKLTGTNLSQFKGRELSHLTTLDCSTNLSLEIIRSLTSLTHLTLRGNTLGGNTIDNLLTAFPLLTSLRVVGWKKRFQLDTVLTHHGRSLRALAMHEFEHTDAANPREVLLVEELIRIRDCCPHLEELSIDLNIPENPLPESEAYHLNTDIHRDVYDILSSFPSLQRIQLNFNLGIASMNNLHTSRPGPNGTRHSVPLADESFVESVWAAVNFGRTASSTIQELRLSQGEAQRPTRNGYPARWVLWEQRAHHWLKATRSERDDEPDKIVISKYRDTPDFSDDIWKECQW